MKVLFTRIKNCKECPFCHFESIEFVKGDFYCIYFSCPRKLCNITEIDKLKTIPLWCPLPDQEYPCKEHEEG